MKIDTKTLLLAAGGLAAAFAIYKIATRNALVGLPLSQAAPTAAPQPQVVYTPAPVPAPTPTFNPPPMAAHSGYQWVLGAGPSGPLWIQSPAQTPGGMHWQQMGTEFTLVPNTSSVAYIDPRPSRPSMIISVPVPTPAA